MCGTKAVDIITVNNKTSYVTSLSTYWVGYYGNPLVLLTGDLISIFGDQQNTPMPMKWKWMHLWVVFRNQNSESWWSWDLQGLVILFTLYCTTWIINLQPIDVVIKDTLVRRHKLSIKMSWTENNDFLLLCVLLIMVIITTTWDMHLREACDVSSGRDLSESNLLSLLKVP